MSKLRSFRFSRKRFEGDLPLVGRFPVGVRGDAGGGGGVALGGPGGHRCPVGCPHEAPGLVVQELQDLVELVCLDPIVGV